MKWTDNEIKYLKENFSNSSNLELSSQLNKSISSITTKASNIGLKKSKEHKSKMISKRNKIVGRDLSLEKL